MEKPLWVAAGYPVLVAAIGILWRALRAKDREVRAAMAQLLAEKERQIKLLENFRKLILKERHQ